MTPATRRLVHSRSINVDAYLRDDALWDLVATMRDIKTRDLELEDGVRPAGTPLHDMELTLTIDAGMQIVAASATTHAAPFTGTCQEVPAVYQALVGLNLLQHFRASVRERVGGNKGCTHITELATVLPTVAIQAFAGHARRPDRTNDEMMPTHLDRCRALRLDGPVVRTHYPRWFTPVPAESPKTNQGDDQ